MVKYIAKRLLLCLLVLFGVSVIIYCLVLLMPTDFVDQKFASQIAQGAMDKQAIQEMKEKYALADKSFAGIFNGYFNWLGGVCTGDLGRSFKYDAPVTTVIVENMGISFGISFVALVLQFAIAIPLGIKAACNQYGKTDYIVTILTMMGISLPTFFLAALLVQVFAINLGWFPVNGLVTANLPTDTSAFMRFLDELWHLVLPMTTLVILSIGGLMRHTRTNMLEVLNADYIRTARAKGLSERTVVYKHAFKNTMIPIVTMTAGIIPSLFGGAMITETVFGIPGIGKMAYDALKIGDVPFVMGYNMFLAILTVLGTLLSDLMYMVVDPRVKLTK
ncbi:MAG: ABC transporter permease [Clostridiales bacterium]|nr:ABC transporter permease [Clostridiales bacterium]